jgi:hypothetical protein
MQGPPAPEQRTAAAMSGAPAPSDPTQPAVRTAAAMGNGMYTGESPSFGGRLLRGAMSLYPPSAFGGGARPSAQPSGPQPAGPVVTKQPGQRAATPQDRAAWLRMLAGE